ncbi:hypothetical protein D3C85_1897940 [compost metagenome]
MQIMDINNAFNVQQLSSDIAGIHVQGSALHQNMKSLPDYPPGTPQNKQSHNYANDGIGYVPGE